MKQIDGKGIADQMLKSAAQKIKTEGLTPRLDIIWVGDNPSSEVYVEKKRQAGESIGVKVNVHRYTEISAGELGIFTGELSAMPEVNGIIIQLPVPGIDPHSAFAEISPAKDVDGLNPTSLGKLWQKQDVLIPATVRAVLLVLEYIAAEEETTTGLILQGREVLIINRSDIIGKPLAALLLAYDCTVTIAHSKTDTLDELISRADIIVSGTGKSGLITSRKIKEGVILIDVGFNKKDGKISGDIISGLVEKKAGWLSPVPNGIGPIGVAALIDNTVDAAIIQKKSLNKD
jgi:methylenetetrahydrofolate dehydrogenase (NADP+)/methenyltetrahydrofolate cyclohydrolase